MDKIKWALAVAVGLLAFYYGSKAGSWLFGLENENKRLHTELLGQKERYEQLSEYAAKLENKYVEQEELRRKAEEQFEDEKEAFKSRIKVLSNATYLIRERARKSSQSDLVYQGKHLKYLLNEIRFNEGPPVGYVLIFDNGRVVSKLYNHSIVSRTAVSRDESTGRYSIVSKADYVLKSPSLNLNGEKNWVNKPYPLNIVGGTALIDPTEPNSARKKFHWWAPRLNLEAGFTGSEVRPGLGVSLMGYGYTTRDLDYKFLQLGTQYSREQTLIPTLSPIMWRPLPTLFSNTYIGAGFSYDNPGVGYLLSLQVGL